MNWSSHFTRSAVLTKRTAVRELLKLTAQPDMISFAGGLPAPELFPVERIREAVDRALHSQPAQALQYGETEGLAELRDWIALKFSRPGREIRRENVLLVSGAQQGLDLIGRILVEDGSEVIVENPTYLALLSAWRPLGANFMAAPSDAEGMCVDAVPSLLERNPKLLYAIPNFQNPQGTTLSLARRQRLLRMLEGSETAIVEDDPYGELRYSGEPVPHLLDLESRAEMNDSRVIHVGTFSKILAPGLRLGWVIAARPVIEKLVQIKQAVDLHTSALSQGVVLEMVRDGFLAGHIEVLRNAYRQRRDAMLAALEEHFPDEVQWTRPEGGMFLVAALPHALDAKDLLADALRRKVAFVPGEEFHLNGQGRNTFRLNFSNASLEQIEEGIKRLAGVVKERILGKNHLCMAGC